MFVTLKALFLRYVYTLRQRWCLTLCYMLCPLIWLLLAVWAYKVFPYSELKEELKHNTERSLLKIPAQVKIAVSPDGDAERRIMGYVNNSLHLEYGSTPALEITFTDDNQQMMGLLVSANTNISIGVNFNVISATKLEYTIRPQAFNVPAINLDSGDYRTAERFPSPMYRGPRRSDPYFDVPFIELIGFIRLQVAIDEAYIQTYFPNESRHWGLVSFPYPPYFEAVPPYSENFTHRFTLVVVEHLLIFGISFLISVFASDIISDKTSGIKVLLSINGAHPWIVSMSQLMAFSLEATVLAFAEVKILKTPTRKGALIQYMSSTVLAIVLIVYNVSSLCWVFFIATISTNKVLCVLIVAAYWWISPTVLELIPPGRFILQACLAPFPNAGMVLMFKSFQEFDGAETVLNWDRLYTAPIHFLPVGALLLEMLVTSVLLVLLSMYIDLVKPGPFDRAKPWYSFIREREIEDLPADGAVISQGILFDYTIMQETVGLECVGLYKLYGRHKVIDNVNLKISKNRATVLFGRNGAGKTSLISILSGLNSPTRGNILMEEYDVFKGNNIRRFQKVLGYCPQSNMLMNDLTFQQNLIVFAMLKGLSRHEAEDYGDKWAAMFNIEKCLYRQVKYLSSGDRRMLSLAIAMSGKPQYLLLDDPTSGLDFKSTNQFWNLILRKKNKCTVFLSTTNLNEADILGDQIVFMDNGRLKGHVSSSFLKRKIDFSYKVTCTVNKNDIEKLIRLVTNFNPSIHVLSQMNQSVTFGLPSDFNSKNVPILLQSLGVEFGENIHFHVSHFTTEDAFVQLIHMEGKVNLEGLIAHERDIVKSKCNLVDSKEVLKKKMKWTCHQSLISIIVLTLLPAVGMGFAIYVTNMTLDQIRPSISQPVNLTLTMDKYRGSIALISKEKCEVNDALRSAVKTNKMTYEEVDGDMINFLTYSLAVKDLFKYRSRYVFAFDTKNDTFTAYYSRNAFHSAPIAYSAMVNALLLGKATIVTHNFPFIKEHERLACSFNNAQVAALLLLYLLGPMLLITSSYFIVFPHEERRTLFKQLQQMTGLLPVVYWTVNLLSDMVIFSISCVLMFIVVAIMDDNFFWSFTVVCDLVAVLLFYGFSTIIFAYLWSFLRCSASMVVTWFIHVIPCLFIIHMLLHIVILFSEKDISTGNKQLHFLPWVILMDSLEQISLRAVNSRRCDICGSIDSCVKITEFRSLRRNLLSFVLISLGCFTLLLAMDHGFGRRLKPIINRMCHGDILAGSYCPEVTRERVRVRDLDTTTDDEVPPELVCDGLGKKCSSKITAVQDISFATDRGELFGLLGQNGAGKTTVLRMLAGMITPSKGTATIHGKWELGDCEYKYIRNIGYCPQFEGLLPGLTGRFTLRLFARLRGLQEGLLDTHVEKWLEALDMKYVADRPCEQYSQGERKKFNFAIAVIGNPSVVLLDDHTTSVDPFIKIKIRNILLGLSKQHKQAIVIATNNTVECEALCDRLMILVNGETKCIGSVLELKKSLGKMCTIKVTLLDNITPALLNAIKFKIEFRFAGYITLKKKQPNLLIYSVLTEKIKVYDIFANMVQIKEENPAIDDFSVAEAPLEEGFAILSHEE